MAGDSASLDEQGRKRPRPAFFGRKTGKGECIYLDSVPPLDKLAETFRQDESAGLPGIAAAAGVVYNVVEQPESRRVVVHLLNYTLAPADDVRIELKKHYRGALLLSPDLSREVSVTIAHRSSHLDQVTIPELRTYAVLVLNE